MVWAQFPGEVGASIIANALEAEGVTSALTGVNTASYFTGVPGLVGVMVRREDVERAQQILDELRNSESTTDWENLDVGEPE